MAHRDSGPVSLGPVSCLSCPLRPAWMGGAFPWEGAFPLAAANRPSRLGVSEPALLFNLPDKFNFHYSRAVSNLEIIFVPSPTSARVGKPGTRDTDSANASSPSWRRRPDATDSSLTGRVPASLALRQPAMARCRGPRRQRHGAAHAHADRERESNANLP